MAMEETAMARTVNSEAMREAFAQRLHEELDRVGFTRNGRGSAMARDLQVSHTTTNSWLNGSMPAVSVLVDVCKRYNLDFTYLCTGSRENERSTNIDPEVFRRATDAVNAQIQELDCLGEIGLGRLGMLYMRAYVRMIETDDGDPDISEDVRLAAGR